MFEVLSWVLKYVFILLIYLFIFRIIHLIYLDIKTMSVHKNDLESAPYLKLINLRDRLDFAMQESYPLHKSIITIGRDNKNDIVIRDPFISGRHSRILANNGQYFIEDLKSSNGTYVNGRQVEEATLLYDGDRISLGQIDFLFVKSSK